MLDENDQVFVSGFDLGEKGDFVTRERYMAPELWRLNTGSINHDKVFMFSLGVELYFWLTKKFPFKNSE